jgi:GNAT superfamily N-acetyltransferase
MTSEDVGIVASTWIKSFRHLGTFSRGVMNRVYYQRHQELLEQLIPRSSVFVAANEEDPSQVVGWICYELYENVLYLHYIYVKLAFRRFGIASLLMDQILKHEHRGLVFHSHNTKDFGEWSQDYQCSVATPEFWYDPYVMFMVLSKTWQNRTIEEVQYILPEVSRETKDSDPALRDPRPEGPEDFQEKVPGRYEPKLEDIRRHPIRSFKRRLRKDIERPDPEYYVATGRVGTD